MITKLITLIITFVFSCNAFAQEETCQNIDFPTGWSIISTYIEITAQYNEAQAFFTPLVQNNSFIISKTDDGSAFVPPWGFDHLVDNNEAFQVKLSISDTLTYCGNQITPELFPISIEQGWNLIPYLRDTPQDAVEALSDIANEIILVKDYLGNIYLPSMNFNGIGDLEPGKGYQIKMISEQTLIYDANE